MTEPVGGVGVSTLLDLSAQVLCVCDFDGRIQWCNRGFERTLGFTRDETVGSLFGDLLQDDYDFMVDLLAKREAGPSEKIGVQVPVTAADGARHWLEWTTLVDLSRGLLYLAGRDVTEWIEARDATRSGTARLRAVLDHNPSPVVVYDTSGAIVLANQAYLDLTADSVLLLRERAMGVLGSASAISVDLQLQGVDTAAPALFDVMVSISPLQDESGAVHAVCCIATDISERKRVERSLMAREQVLDTVLRASPDIISLIDKHGSIHQVSTAEQTMLGYRHDAPEHEELLPLVHPEDFDEVASGFIAMVTGSVRRLHVRYRVHHADGNWVTVDSRAQAVDDDEGNFLGAVVVTRDITERLRSEQRLEAIRDAAEQASRAKNEFLSRMSHELRTPLNAILGFAELLQMDELPVQQSDAVAHITRAGHHLLELINEVLDIARIESGHMDLAIVPVRLSNVVASAVRLTAPIAERSDVVLEVALPAGGGPAVLADRQRLLQIVLNLVTNAVKYNRPGGRVDISCETTEAGRVRLSVADTGHGIRPEDAGRVFEPFERLGAEQVGVEGTGVGLALARTLAQQMGGTIEVESVPEVGSTFVVDLPYAALADEADFVAPDGDDGGDADGGPSPFGAADTATTEADGASPGAPAKSSSATPGAGEGADDFAVWHSDNGHGGASSFTVLLVEPNLDSMEGVKRALARRRGVTVLGATQGTRGFDLARQRRPDLVLAGMHLTDMPTSVLLDRLGEDAATSRIPVAVLADDGETDAGKSRLPLGRGVVGHLSRPVDARALRSLVDAVRAAKGT
ncbi:MAG: PAS domain S-box protein [Acidimicrobiales bacterium]